MRDLSYVLETLDSKIAKKWTVHGSIFCETTWL